jgi:hypothetical protein
MAHAITMRDDRHEKQNHNSIKNLVHSDRCSPQIPTEAKVFDRAIAIAKD